MCGNPVRGQVIRCQKSSSYAEASVFATATPDKSADREIRSQSLSRLRPEGYVAARHVVP